MGNASEALKCATAHLVRANQSQDDVERFRDLWSALNAIYDSESRDGSELARAKAYVAEFLDDADLADLVELPQIRWLSEREVVWEPSWGTRPAAIEGISGVLGRPRNAVPEEIEVARIDPDLLDQCIEEMTGVDRLRDDLIEVIYSIRNNVVHGNKEIDRPDNLELVSKAVVPLAVIVGSVVAGFSARNCERDGTGGHLGLRRGPDLL